MSGYMRFQVFLVASSRGRRRPTLLWGRGLFPPLYPRADVCVSGSDRGRMAPIWLAAVILEVSSRSRPPTERGSPPIEQGMDGGRLAGTLRAGGLGLWVEMGLMVWYNCTAERACWQSWRGQSLVSSPPWALNFLLVVLPACVSVWVRLPCDKHTETQTNIGWDVKRVTKCKKADWKICKQGFFTFWRWKGKKTVCSHSFFVYFLSLQCVLQISITTMRNNSLQKVSNPSSKQLTLMSMSESAHYLTTWFACCQ